MGSHQLVHGKHLPPPPRRQPNKSSMKVSETPKWQLLQLKSLCTPAQTADDSKPQSRLLCPVLTQLLNIYLQDDNQDTAFSYQPYCPIDLHLQRHLPRLHTPSLQSPPTQTILLFHGRSLDHLRPLPARSSQTQNQTSSTSPEEEGSVRRR
ncbi:DENN domain-containing protein 1B isoform X1 [Lates japonicus]|uniref:DENN domain-containing protein 1B isoform X1 n=1 Tax=Lates japonicus TaxID=270547 RepID=A0AAD3NN31_LATJO|nr:DENN domain-containing protein 1B isoform X1 [Lates japonicus]